MFTYRHANFKHWFTGHASLEEGAGKRCSECDRHADISIENIFSVSQGGSEDVCCVSLHMRAVFVGGRGGGGSCVK